MSQINIANNSYAKTLCDNNDKPSINILVVGDSQVGKTSLINKFIEACGFPEAKKNVLNESKQCVHNSEFNLNCGKYTPTVIDVQKAELKVNNKDYYLSITDLTGNTASQKHNQIREYFYRLGKKMDVVLMCFSLCDEESFENIKKKWYKDICTYYPGVPLILVGTKSDIKQYFKKNKNKKLKPILTASQVQIQQSSQHQLFKVQKQTESTQTIEYRCEFCARMFENQQNNTNFLPSNSKYNIRPLSFISTKSQIDLFPPEQIRNDLNLNNLLNELRNNLPMTSLVGTLDNCNMFNNNNQLVSNCEQLRQFNFINSYNCINSNKTLVSVGVNTDDESNDELNRSKDLAYSYVNTKKAIECKNAINAKHYIQANCISSSSVGLLFQIGIQTAVSYHLKENKKQLVDTTIDTTLDSTITKQDLSSKIDSSCFDKKSFDTENNNNTNKVIDLVSSVNKIDINNNTTNAVNNNNNNSNNKKGVCKSLKRFRCFSCTRSETSTSLNNI